MFVLGAALLAYIVLNVGSWWALRQLPAVPEVVVVPAGGDAVEGERLASILGCKGCHGADLGGAEDCFERPGQYRLTCPNITAARDLYTDRDLVILLRHGRKIDGALVDFMPWDMYAQLTDSDLANVIAYVRAAPYVDKPALHDSQYSLAVRWQMLRGEYPWQNDLADYDTKPLDGPAERGRYLASVSCPECHAPNLRGYEGDTAPSLTVVQAYPPEAFARLMREGITMTGRESASGLMTAVARDRFSHFTAEEVVALKAYFDQRTP
ncbi:MAG TPA: cytochrome c [Steroidobacteraceae bacterium]